MDVDRDVSEQHGLLKVGSYLVRMSVFIVIIIYLFTCEIILAKFCGTSFDFIYRNYVQFRS